MPRTFITSLRFTQPNQRIAHWTAISTPITSISWTSGRREAARSRQRGHRRRPFQVRHLLTSKSSTTISSAAAFATSSAALGLTNLGSSDGASTPIGAIVGGRLGQHRRRRCSSNWITLSPQPEKEDQVQPRQESRGNKTGITRGSRDPTAVVV